MSDHEPQQPLSASEAISRVEANSRVAADILLDSLFRGKGVPDITAEDALALKTLADDSQSAEASLGL